MTNKEKLKIAWTRFSDEFREGPEDLYLACQAVEYYGMELRDNSFEELVEIGRSIEKGEKL